MAITIPLVHIPGKCGSVEVCVNLFLTAPTMEVRFEWFFRWIFTFNDGPSEVKGPSEHIENVLLFPPEGFVLLFV